MGGGGPTKKEEASVAPNLEEEEEDAGEVEEVDTGVSTVEDAGAARTEVEVQSVEEVGCGSRKDELANHCDCCSWIHLYSSGEACLYGQGHRGMAERE